MKISNFYILTFAIIAFTAFTGFTFTLPSFTINLKDLVKQDREINEFKSIILAGSADLIITEGNSFSLKLEGSEKGLTATKTEVKNKKLTISQDDCYNCGQVKIYITLKELEGISILGSGDVVTKNTIHSNELSLSIKGSGDMKINTETKSLKTEIKGSGDMQIEGSADDFDISIKGSGDISAYGFKVKNCEVSTTGSGDCQLYVTDELDISINGSGDIHYKGNPTTRNSIYGSGDIKKVN